MSLTNFSDALAFVQSQGYTLMFLAMIIEGPIVTSAAAFAASLGFFNIFLVLLLSILGDLVADFLYFGIGKFVRVKGVEKYGHYLGLKPQRLESIETHLHNNFGKTIFIVKFTPGLAAPGLMLMGALKVKLNRFIWWSFILTLPRAIFFTALGFYFGLLYDSLAKYLKWGEYTFILLIIFIFLGYLLFKKLSSKVVKDVEKKI